MLVVFVLNEVRQPEPVLDFSLFRIGGVAPALAASLLQGLGSFALLFLVIMYLQGARGLSPIEASLLMVPGYVVGAFAAPLPGDWPTASAPFSRPPPGWPSSPAR